MSVVAPCITVETADEYSQAVERLKPFAERVHIDISDGQFAPVLLFDSEKIWWPREWVVDIHAMVMQPKDYVDKLIALKPNLITFHVETGVDLLPIIQKIQKFGIKAGIAFLRPTVPATVAPLIVAADHALIFSGDLGHYGGVANMMQLEKIRLIRKINPNIEIGWDGGVNSSNAFTLTQGGVGVLNVGGAISTNSNPEEAYRKLIDESNKEGVL